MGDLNNKTIQGLMNTLPYYAKNKNNLDKILKPVNVLKSNLNQSVVNALVSQYDQTLPYDIIKNKTRLTSLRPMVPHAGNNLVLNVRCEYGENAARYSFGYKPNVSDTHHKYYMFSDVVPTTRDPEMSDYIYVDSSCYDEFLYPKELQKIAKNENEALLTMPLVLKHWEHLCNFFSDGETLRNSILEDLKKNDCMEYFNRLQGFQTTFYSAPTIDIEELTRDECFYALLAYFLEDYYGVDHNTMKKEEIGRLMYKVVGDSDLSSLNVKFPPTMNMDLGMKSNNGPKEAPFRNIPRPLLPPPLPPMNRPMPNFPLSYMKNPPPPPPMNNIAKSIEETNKNIATVGQNINNVNKQISDVNKIYFDKSLSPSSDEVYNKLKDVMNDINQQAKSLDKTKLNGLQKQGMTFMEELKAKIKDRFVGGFSYDKNKSDIKEVDVGSFPDSELEFQKSTVPRLNGPSVAKLGSIEDLKYRLFSNARVGGFVNTPMFLKRMKELYEILSQNSHHFLEYSFKEYDIETFVFADNMDMDAIRAYRLYFEILRGIVFGMNDKSGNSVANIPRENLMYIGLSAVVMLNNFGYYVFGDLIAFRNYIEGFYTLVKRLNVSEVPVVSLYSSIHTCVDDFLEKTKLFIGGSEGGSVFDYQPHFSFFKHVYLLDILRSHKLGISVQPKYLSSSMNDDPLALFWDGVSLTNVYNGFSLEKKYLYTVMYKTYFISTCAKGSKLKTSYKEVTSTPSKSENARAIFLADQLSDKCSHQEMLDKLTQRVMKDITNEIDVETLAEELEKIFGADVIRTMDKLKVIDDPSKVPIFMQIVKDKKLDLDSPSVLESLMFLFVILEKLGFVVTKNFSKTNMVLQVQPALIRENIEKHLGKSSEQCELNNKFIEKYGNLLEELLNKSSLATRLNGGANETNKTEITISLPRTSDLVSNKNITPENVESVFLGKENPISNEVKDLEKGIEIMLNTNSTSEDVLYRLIPYYVKEQIRLVSDLPEIKELGGAPGDPIIINIPDNENNPDIISQFLDRVQTVSEQTRLDSPLTQEEVTKTIDKFLKENYIQSVNRLLPFYDNKISVGNGRDRSYLLLKHTLDTINYLRSNMKVDFDINIKTGIASIIKLRRSSDDYCYKIFIIIQYIRHMIEELYNRLRVQPSPRTINFNEFSIFFKVITQKLKERDMRLKELSDKKTQDYINQRLGTNIPLQNINMDADGQLFSLFNPNVSRARMV